MKPILFYSSFFLLLIVHLLDVHSTYLGLQQGLVETDTTIRNIINTYSITGFIIFKLCLLLIFFIFSILAMRIHKIKGEYISSGLSIVSSIPAIEVVLNNYELLT